MDIPLDVTGGTLKNKKPIPRISASLFFWPSYSNFQETASPLPSLYLSEKQRLVGGRLRTTTRILAFFFFIYLFCDVSIFAFIFERVFRSNTRLICSRRLPLRPRKSFEVALRKTAKAVRVASRWWLLLLPKCRVFVLLLKEWRSLSSGTVIPAAIPFHCFRQSLTIVASLYVSWVFYLYTFFKYFAVFTCGTSTETYSTETFL